METSIETIRGRLCTVIRKPFDADEVTQIVQLGGVVEAETRHGRTRYIEDVALIETEDHPYGIWMYRGYDRETLSPFSLTETSFTNTVKRLPALPRKPLSDRDLDLICAYRSHGIFIYSEREGYLNSLTFKETYHILSFEYDESPCEVLPNAVDYFGNLVTVAIED